MKSLLKISILSLVGLFFMSTTGLTVYKHYCLQDGHISKSFLANNQSCNEHMEMEENHSCCEIMEIDYDNQISDDCCLNEIDFFQIGTDLLNHNGSIEFVYVSSFDFEIPAVIGTVEKSKVKFANNSPPFIQSTLERLSNLQVYEI